MNDFAIQVKELSKRYRIGEHNPRRATRELMESFIRAPFNWVKGNSPLTSFQPKFIWALRDVTFTIGHGEVVAIIGKNGAGKSALLKILARVTKPTAGSAQIVGRVGALLEAGAGFHSDLNGHENILLNGIVLGMPKRVMRNKIHEIAMFAELEMFLDTPIKRYSSGMKARLAFSIAVHIAPEILIVDEVLSVGDESFKQKSLLKIKELIGAGHTILFVSHHLDTVREICHRAMLLENGRLIIDDKVNVVIDRYQKPIPR